MSEQKIPEAWIGEQVALRYTQGAEYSAVVGMLRDLSELGIVIDSEEKVRFYPWTSVVSLEEAGEDIGP